MKAANPWTSFNDSSEPTIFYCPFNSAAQQAQLALLNRAPFKAQTKPLQDDDNYPVVYASGSGLSL